MTNQYPFPFVFSHKTPSKQINWELVEFTQVHNNSESNHVYERHNNHTDYLPGISKYDLLDAVKLKWFYEADNQPLSLANSDGFLS